MRPNRRHPLLLHRVERADSRGPGTSPRSLEDTTVTDAAPAGNRPNGLAGQVLCCGGPGLPARASGSGHYSSP
jgi:hypothetical protein